MIRINLLTEARAAAARKKTGIVPTGARLNNLILLAVCFGLGILLRRSGRLPPNAHTALNGFIINVSLPALTLTSVHRLSLDWSLLAPATMAWTMFGLGCGFFWWVGRALKLRPATIGALMLTGSLARTTTSTRSS